MRIEIQKPEVAQRAQAYIESGRFNDADIPSETVKLRPEPRVTAWIRQQANETL